MDNSQDLDIEWDAEADSETGSLGEEHCSSSWESLDDEEDLYQKISHNTLVLEKVFYHLPVSELLKCRLVSKLWNSTALLQNHLGSKTFIKITNLNIERFTQARENSSSPFCRRFGLFMLPLDDPSIIPFNKGFRNCLTSLSIESCTAASSTPIIKFLKAPNLKDVKIVGALPEFDKPMPFRKHQLPGLINLELRSSTDAGGGQVSQEFMKVLLENSSFLQSISIGGSSSLWKDYVQLASAPDTTNLKLAELRLFNLEKPLEMEDFIGVLKGQKLRSISFENCIIWQDFLQGFLVIVGNQLRKLNIFGAQHEILSRSFSGLTINSLTQITLPIDGISTQDGSIITQALPNLQDLIVAGLFQTGFRFCHQRLKTLDVKAFHNSQCRYENSPRALISEKQREFYKVLSLIMDQPSTLKINLPELNSRGLRLIYQKYPDLHELIVTNNSRHCLDGWTGIQNKVCRKISACRSFAVANVNDVQRLPSVATLKKLKRLHISIMDDPPKTEFSLIYILYGICQLVNLEQIELNNFTISDVAFAALNKYLQLKVCNVNGSSDLWNEFKSRCQNNKIKSFLLPPIPDQLFAFTSHPLLNLKVIRKIFSFLPRQQVFDLRQVSKSWHTSARIILHRKCRTICSKMAMENYLDDSNKSSKTGQTSPNKTPRKILYDTQSQRFTQALNLLRNESTLTTLVIRGMNKSMLEFYQRENFRKSPNSAAKSCQERRKITYWFYPDGNDDLFTPLLSGNPKATSITLIGSWGKKDTGLLEFLDPSFNITSIILNGLLQEVYDLVLPRLTCLTNLESVTISPFSSSSVSEIARNHLQIMSNSSFGLKHLTMQKLQVPPEAIAKLVQSHRYTLETLNIQNHVNVSDRLSFTIPHLRILQLDEPPGALLWTTLNINQSLESIHFERSGYIYNQIKSKAMPKLELVDQDFEHSATNMLCDVNLFLECVSNRLPGVQRSILQEGSDSALKFFTHFRYLTSLTVRSAHAHYGILQGIFRNFSQLEKLIFTNTTGITDEILTGFPKTVLDTMDLFNPLHFKKMENSEDFLNPSIRDLKNLTHLSLDDQTCCTDLSVIFGILRLKRLEYFSCKKWKITDVSMRAVADMTSIKHMITDGTTSISKYGIDYFNRKEAK